MGDVRNKERGGKLSYKGERSKRPDLRCTLQKRNSGRKETRAKGSKKETAPWVQNRRINFKSACLIPQRTCVEERLSCGGCVRAPGVQQNRGRRQKEEKGKLIKKVHENNSLNVRPWSLRLTLHAYCALGSVFGSAREQGRKMQEPAKGNKGKVGAVEERQGNRKSGKTGGLMRWKEMDCAAGEVTKRLEP